MEKTEMNKETQSYIENLKQANRRLIEKPHLGLTLTPNCGKRMLAVRFYYVKR